MMNWENTLHKYLIIGAGPTGLACASVFLKQGIDFYVVESSHEVGGLWDISNPKSTMYETAHLISSRTQTEFTEFPMNNTNADFPKHTEVFEYLKDFSNVKDLRNKITFNLEVLKLTPTEDTWNIELSNGEIHTFKGIVMCSGILSEPRIPSYKGVFEGELIHSAAYKSSTWFNNKKVLIVGGGNSGCDITVDAVHHAKEVYWSLRRGYHFLPKYVLGKPIDLLGKSWMPKKLKLFISKLITRFFIGDVTNFGLQKPDHKLYQVHPILNSLVLHYLGHGDIKPKVDIKNFEGNTVEFEDGTKVDVDAIVMCTGYKIHYPYIDKQLLNWDGVAPRLFMNIFHPEYNNLFVLGMVEAAGLGWQGKYDQANLVAHFIKNLELKTPSVKSFLASKKVNDKDLSGGSKYLKIDRMAYYVHKDTYKKELNNWIKRFEKDSKT
jgi:hypothetical protein